MGNMSPFVFCPSCLISVFEATTVTTFSYILLKILRVYICVYMHVCGYTYVYICVCVYAVSLFPTMRVIKEH